MRKLLLAAIFVWSVSAANHAIVPSTLCPNNGDGTKWTCAPSGGAAGAFNDLPTASLVRGDVYYLADGTYSGTYTISTATSGTSIIEFRKAQAYDFGGLTGWNTLTMGMGQARFTNFITNNTSYITYNGNGALTDIGCGGVGKHQPTSVFALLQPPFNNPADCGLLWDNFGGSNSINQYNQSGTNLIFRSIESRGNGNNATEQHEVQGPSGAGPVTYDHMYMHNAGCVYFQDMSNGVTISNGYFWGTEVNGATGGCHGQFEFENGSTSNSVEFNNVFRDITGTAIWTFANSSTTHNNNIYYNNIIFDSSPAVSWSPFLSDGILACINAGTNCTNFVLDQNSIINLPATSSNGINNENTGSYTVQNNIWYNNGFATGFNAGTGGTFTQDHNSYINNKSCPSGTSNGCDGSFSSPTAPNPFINWQNGNFNLATSNTDWNARAALGSPYTLDLNGSTFTSTRGAYQYSAFTSTPIIFYTDQLSGVTSGGEGNNGSYLTIYGNNFGATQSTSKVFINGTEVATYLTWANKQIGVQVGAVTTGSVTVTVGGIVATGPRWIARAGNIYYVDGHADNTAPASCASMKGGGSNNGTFASPWGFQTNVTSTTQSDYGSYASVLRTPATYTQCLAAGDTLVFLSGANYLYFDGRSLEDAMTVPVVSSPTIVATADKPITVVVRPSATVTMGGFNNQSMAAGSIGIRVLNDNIVVSGFISIGRGKACVSNCTAVGGVGLEGGNANRIIGNDVQCPDCSSSSSSLDHFGPLSFVAGNHVHNTTVGFAGSKTWHSVYFDASNVEVAWNRIDNFEAVAGAGPYNGIQVNNNNPPPFGDSNISFHDNIIEGQNGCGINWSTVGFTLGAYLVAYNNIIYHNGLATASSPGPHCGISFKGYSSDQGVGTMKIFNNTLYDTSSYLNTVNDNADSAALYDVEPNLYASGTPGGSTYASGQSFTGTGQCNINNFNNGGSTATAVVQVTAGIPGFLCASPAGCTGSGGTNGFADFTGPPTTAQTTGVCNGTATATVGTININGIIQGQPKITRLWVNNIISQPTYTNTNLDNVYWVTGILPSEILTYYAGSSNNIWFSITTPASNLQAPSFGTVIGATSPDPILNNPVAGDFTLKAGSPAAAAGTNTLMSITDINGYPRPNIPSAGAIEAADTTLCQFSLTTLPNAKTGVAYSQTILTSGCAAPTITVQSGSLPAWATLTAGVISGTPSGATPTTSSFSLGINDANCSVPNSGLCLQALSILDITPPTITTTSPLTGGAQNVAYGPVQFTGTGDTGGACTVCVWSATGVPTGMAFSSGGLLNGTPTGFGVFTLNVSVTNNSGAGSAGPSPFSLTISSSATAPGGCGMVGTTGLVGISGCNGQ